MISIGDKSRLKKDAVPSVFPFRQETIVSLRALRMKSRDVVSKDESMEGIENGIQYEVEIEEKFSIPIDVADESHISKFSEDKDVQYLDIWPSREVIDDYMPVDFGRKFPTTRVILDATEIPIQKPSDVNNQSVTWSSYKHRNTIKTIVGCTPRGAGVLCFRLLWWIVE
ncbi:unnamed protein product [Mytilus coruscus]|uniref:DDE Tnp4 domain-containing protein n=1 Tax=Mytilus coruscus TaxID=42192 RepID=A0A6J8BPR7_MYTCO|nr:unnamed protein product [Mytilus coruscus]